MNISLKNLSIVITGSSKGIGKALANAFVKEGANVVANYHRTTDICVLEKEMSIYRGKCIYQKADVSKEKDVCILYKRAIEEFGRVDVLINNAGISYDQRINLMTCERWEEVIDVNLTGVFLCSKIFSKIMIKQKRGKIINIASYMGMNGRVGMAAYAASKAGVIGLTKVMAKEFSPFGITVNSICPGPTRTGINSNKYVQKENQTSIIENRFALDDMISMILLLSSESIKGISGQNLCLGSRE